MTRPFTEIFGMFPPGEGDVRRVAMTAARAGFAVVPVKPLAKAPLCTLNQNERRALKGGRHECGVHHWTLDADRIDRDFKRLTKDIPDDLHLNLGIVPGPSRLIMADADTPEAVAAMRQWWDGPPNVLTPGVNRSGEWVHKEGGHWYWAIPDDLAMPTIKKQRTVDGVDFRWSDNLQALVPPSTRAEGPYVCRGDIPDVPESVLDLIFDWTSSIEVKRERRLEQATFRNDKVAAWSIRTSWEDLLTPDGWDATGRLDPGCGCPEWEKPGGGSSSRRSALAHEGECDKYPNVENHGPLHVFTSDPPEGIARYKEATGSSTMTKLQYVAWTHHDGDVEAAKRALGLAVTDEQILAWLGTETPAVTGSNESQSPEVAVTQKQPSTRDDEPIPSPTSLVLRD